MLESKFQSNLVNKIKEMFPSCTILKGESGYQQGIPDLLILYRDKWAALECKRDLFATHQPNQDYYIDLFNEMSFASFICPENEQEVLDELQQAFKSGRSTRISKSK